MLSVTSRNGTRFEGVSYLLPWITANGSGIDIVPKVGDQCLVAAEPEAVRVQGGSMAIDSSRRWRFAVCLGFKLPGSPNAEGVFLGDRISGLPQGSIALRSVSEDGNEAMLLLTRGGTAMLTANETCRTVYSPVDSSISHIFDNWQMKGPGGHVKWTRAEDSEAVKYEAEYRSLVSEDEGHRVRVTIDEEADNPIEIRFDNIGYGRPLLHIYIDERGEAHVEGEQINIRGRAGVSIDGAEVRIKNRQVLGQGDPI
jgi:hypothetical protein